MRRAVFFDRDGTLNRCFPTDDGAATRPPASVADLVLVDGAAKACSRLRREGYVLLVVTNQPDVARGTQTQARAEEINHRVVDALGLDDFLACYHDNADGCDCRKPLPGLIQRLAARHGVDASRSWMVGDRTSDVAAGRAAGCTTILVSPSPADVGQDHTAPTLVGAADLIVTTRVPQECA